MISVFDIDSIVLTHGWINEVINTPDIRLRSHRITMTYNKLGNQWDELTYFDFAAWGTHMVGRVIRGELPPTLFEWVEPVHDEVGNHLGQSQLDMFEHIAHEGVDRKRRGVPSVDIFETAMVEQVMVTKGITDSVNVIADHWKIDRDLTAQFFTMVPLGVQTPGVLLLPSQRIEGTVGIKGAPVEDYRDVQQRTMWILGILETYMYDSSFKSSMYTREQEKEIINGTIFCH